MMVGAATLISDDYIEMNGLCAKRLFLRNDFRRKRHGVPMLRSGPRAVLCDGPRVGVRILRARQTERARVRPKGFDARMDAARQFVTLALLCFLR
jgi:hypothetical protein